MSPLYRFSERCNNIKWYIKNRFIYKNYLVDTRLPRNTWIEHDIKMLHANFKIFMDYIIENSTTIDTEPLSAIKKSVEKHNSKNKYTEKELTCIAKMITYYYYNNSVEKYRINFTDSEISQYDKEKFDVFIHEHVKFLNSCDTLLMWWIIDRHDKLERISILEKSLYDIRDQLHIEHVPIDGGFSKLKIETSDEYKDLSNTINALEDELTLEEQRMLQLLISIRQELWV